MLKKKIAMKGGVIFMSVMIAAASPVAVFAEESQQETETAVIVSEESDAGCELPGEVVTIIEEEADAPLEAEAEKADIPEGNANAEEAVEENISESATHAEKDSQDEAVKEEAEKASATAENEDGSDKADLEDETCHISSEIIFAKDGHIVLPEPKKDGDVFVEWNTKKDGSGESFMPGEPIPMDMISSLYAIWENAEATEDEAEDAEEQETDEVVAVSGSLSATRELAIEKSEHEETKGEIVIEGEEKGEDEEDPNEFTFEIEAETEGSEEKETTTVEYETSASEE